MEEEAKIIVPKDRSGVEVETGNKQKDDILRKIHNYEGTVMDFKTFLEIRMKETAQQK